MTLAVVSAFPPGPNSLGEFGFHLVRNLVSKPEVARLILLADETEAGPPLAVGGVETRTAWRFNDWRNTMSIARAVRHTKPDAVLFNLQFATFGDRRIPGGMGLLAPAAVKAMGIPTAVVLHNLVENVDMRDAGFASSRISARLMSFAGSVLTRLILRADYVALTIPRYVELLRDKYGADNVLLAPHGAFEPIPLAELEGGEVGRDVLAFGKWGTYKTLETLIEAYRILLVRGGYDDVRIVVAGTDSPNSPGYLAGVRDRCADLPGVVFTGYVPEEDVSTLFRSAMVTVFPYTSTTGSSGVLHQAGSYARAAILPAIGDFAEVIEEEGFVGEYFEPGDPADLADAIATMVDDPARCRAMGHQNHLAAAGIPIEEILDWHLLHLGPLISEARAA